MNIGVHRFTAWPFSLHLASTFTLPASTSWFLVKCFWISWLIELDLLVLKKWWVYNNKINKQSSGRPDANCQNEYSKLSKLRHYYVQRWLTRSQGSLRVKNQLQWDNTHITKLETFYKLTAHSLQLTAVISSAAVMIWAHFVLLGHSVPAFD